MQKLLLKQFFVVGFVTLICLPFAIFYFSHDLFPGKINNKDKATEANIGSSSIESFLQSIEINFTEHLPFKEYLLYYNSFIKFKFFNTSANPEVIIGKDNMLFYMTRNSGDPWGDFRGNNFYSEENLMAIQGNILKRKLLFKKKGIDFFVFVIPNKESVYPENLRPVLSKYKDINKLIQIEKYLENKKDIPFYSIRKDLLNKKLGNKKLYYLYDSHWNELGSYWGYFYIMNYLQIIDKGIKISDISDFNIRVESKPGPDDLINLISLQSLNLNENYIILDKKYNSGLRELFDNVEAYNFEYLTNKTNRYNAYFYCDSFFMYGPRALFAESFYHTYFIWNGLKTDQSKIDFQQIDFFIFEIAERYLDRLLEPIKDEDKPWIF